MASRVEIQPLAVTDLPQVADSWRAVELECDDSHYGLDFGWLMTWTRAHRPAALALVSVRDAGRLTAVGLLERQPMRIWRFAGGGVTPHRRLVALPGTEAAAWDALGRWLEQRPRWWTALEGRGAPSVARALPNARLDTVPEYAMPLARSFDEYLATRSPNTRRGIKGRLRRLARAGVHVRAVEADRHPAVLAQLVELHAARAEQKGEHHPDVDSRMCRLLGSLPADGRVEVRVLELIDDGRTIGVTIRLDYRETGYAYNAGIDPAHMSLGPGVCLELASIADAIGRGLRTFDFGPGRYQYKLDLGGQARVTQRLFATSRSAGGIAVGGAVLIRRAARHALVAAAAGARTRGRRD